MSADPSTPALVSVPRSQLRFALCWAGSFILGFVTCCFTLFLPADRLAQDWFMQVASGDLGLARQIRDGKAKELQRRIDEEIPETVLSVVRYCPHHPSVDYYLSSVKVHYVETGTPIPPRIAGIITNLPPAAASSQPRYYSERMPGTTSRWYAWLMELLEPSP